MTAIRRDGRATPFEDWIRNHPELDSIKERLCVNDVDYWIHQYRHHHDHVGARAVDSIMLLETKTNGTASPNSQRDTLALVNQFLRGEAFGKSGRSFVRCKVFGEKRIVRCFGVKQLMMSSTRPDNSEWMRWHGQLIDIETLVLLLRFERDPDAPSKRLEFRRHHRNENRYVQPRLFAVDE